MNTCTEYLAPIMRIVKCTMSAEPLHILLADDDDADRLLFREALRELPLSTNLTTVSGGEQLMSYLSSNILELPHLLFLDLNMPRKNGFECLFEIKQNEKIKTLPVIIFSTSDEETGIERSFAGGAHLYVVKPPDFPHLVQSIRQVILMSLETDFASLPQKKFVLNNSTSL